MKHQLEARVRLRQRPKRPSPEDIMAWLMDKGTGKSFVILDEWQSRVGNDGDLDMLVVVAPLGSFRNWFEDKTDIQKAEINVHLDPRLRRGLAWAAWTGGAESKRRREYLLKQTDVPRAFFAPVVGLSHGGRKDVRGAKSKLEEYLTQLMQSSKKGVMLAIDESTVIRVKKSNRTKALMRLRELARVRRICTGLVSPKSPMDLFMQFKFLDWRILGFESDVAYRNRYAVVERQCFLPNEMLRGKLKSAARGRPALGLRDSDISNMNRYMLLEELERANVYVQMVPIIKSFRNLDELQEKIAPYSFRVLKDDCLDLQPKTYVTRDVELTDEQQELYASLKSQAVAELGGRHIVATQVIQKIIRMHQILCGHVRDEEGGLLRVKSKRVDELLETLEDHRGKAIIWSTYRPEIDDIVEALKKEYGENSVAQFHGGNKDTRHEDERNFLGFDYVRWMVSSQATGGFGNTWNVANLTVYSSNNYDLELRDQSEDRNHRKGQTEPVTYVDLVARSTVDEAIIRALRKKINLAAQITGDNYREWLI